MSKSNTVNGLAYWRALAYAFRACPGGDDRSSLSHVVFVKNKVVCADGDRFHVGYIGEGTGVKSPVVASRQSVRDLLLGLEYAARMAKGNGGGFLVDHDGKIVTIRYGEKELEHELLTCAVGAIPADFDGPVPVDAPELGGTRQTEIPSGHISDAVSWAKDKGLVTMRGEGGNKPVRIDVRSNDELVASAFLLPVDHPRAVLPPNEPLFDKTKPGPKRGQSILDLQLDIFDPNPGCIRIGDIEMNVTGLPNAARLLRTGPCAHREDKEACRLCTEMAIIEARDAMKAEAAEKVTPIGRKKKDKSVDPEVEGL